MEKQKKVMFQSPTSHCSARNRKKPMNFIKAILPASPETPEARHGGSPVWQFGAQAQGRRGIPQMIEGWMTMNSY